MDKKTGNSLDVIVHEDDIYYIHPLTGQKCQEISQTMQGWSEQNEEDNNGWDRIVQAIEKEKIPNFEQYVYDDVDYEI